MSFLPSFHSQGMGLQDAHSRLHLILSLEIEEKEREQGNSLPVHWLRPCISCQGHTGSLPGQGTKTSHATYIAKIKIKMEIEGVKAVSSGGKGGQVTPIRPQSHLTSYT